LESQFTPRLSKYYIEWIKSTLWYPNEFKYWVELKYDIGIEILVDVIKNLYW